MTTRLYSSLTAFHNAKDYLNLQVSLPARAVTQRLKRHRDQTYLKPSSWAYLSSYTRRKRFLAFPNLHKYSSFYLPCLALPKKTVASDSSCCYCYPCP